MYKEVLSTALFGHAVTTGAEAAVDDPGVPFEDLVTDHSGAVFHRSYAWWMICHVVFSFLVALSWDCSPGRSPLVRIGGLVLMAPGWHMLSAHADFPSEYTSPSPSGAQARALHHGIRSKKNNETIRQRPGRIANSIPKVAKLPEGCSRGLGVWMMFSIFHRMSCDELNV